MLKSALGGLVVLTGAITLFTSCSGNDESGARPGSGNETATFTEADLPHWVVEPVTLIDESDNYMPGQIQGLQVMPNGHIVVMDRTPISIHQFDDSGNWLRQVSREGSGPGELEPWNQIQYAPNGIAVGRMDGTVMLYEPGDDNLIRFSRDFNIQSEDRSSSFVRMLEPGRLLYQSTNRVEITDNSDPDQMMPEFRYGTAFFMNEDGEILRDSVYSTVQHAPLLSISGGGTSIQVHYLPWRFSTAQAFTTDGSIIIGDPENGEIITINANGEEISRSIFRIEERMVTREELNRALEDIPREEHRRAESRIKPHKPAFTRILADDSNRLWLQTSRSDDGFTYVITDLNANPLGRMELPAFHNLAAVRNGRLYIRYTPDDDLHEVRVASLNL
ncbi:MAG: 6-bladed beta-propeller [Balneolia bacterium]|nr:6-bladed beta-propeller [Balneolia bacterium]